MRFTPSLLVAAATVSACTFSGCTKSEPEKPAAAAPVAASSIQGTVLETLPAAPYTYLRVKAAQGEVWAAVPAGDVKVGATVTVMVQVRMDKFQSTTLNRTFDSVYMGTLAGAAPVAAAPVSAAPAAMPPAGAPAAMPAAHGAMTTPPVAMEKVAKATGPDAHAIAEIYARKNDLKDRTISVKGKVTKALSGIMGKTWIHLSDGSGKPQTKDFDLPVTTKDAATVGEVVTVKGVLHIDRDFGSGYLYPVIVEDAKIVR
jgi:hypothetical protein